MPEDPQEAMENITGLAQAALEGMMLQVRPVIEAQIQAVLERNQNIVDQSPVALEHLTNEILDAFFPPGIFNQ